MKGGSLFFDCLLDANPPSPRGYGVAGVREFNPRYAEAEGALLGQFRHLHTDIYGNREFVEHLRNRGKFFDHKSERTGWEWFASRGSAKTSDYAAAMKLEERTARRHLKHFLKLGLVKRTGASTSTEYEIK
jgi:Fic family protein